LAFLNTNSRSGRTGAGRASCRCLLVLCIFLTSNGARLQGQTMDADQVKAAFLFNFAKFITWPPKASTATLEICVAGADPIAEALIAATKGKLIDSHPVAIRKLDSPAGVATCQILYVGNQAKKTSEILAEAARYPIVTVGEDEKFLRRGGMINFVPVDEKLRFEINIDAAGRSGISISSKLLQVARVVHDKS
jgi:hypothetical protein